MGRAAAEGCRALQGVVPKQSAPDGSGMLCLQRAVAGSLLDRRARLVGVTKAGLGLTWEGCHIDPDVGYDRSHSLPLGRETLRWMQRVSEFLRVRPACKSKKKKK